jgi:hypothetical protein
MGSGGIAPQFLTLAHVRFMPQILYPGERDPGGSMDPRASLNIMAKETLPYWEFNLDSLAI